MKKTKNKINWENLDFQYSGAVEYDYYNARDCSSNGCSEEGICRCSKIEDERVISVNLGKLVFEIISRKISTKENQFLDYCIYRLAVIHKMYEPHSWYIKTGGGYYGEEIYGVFIDNQNFKEDVDELVTLSPQERIKYILVKEYGFLLEPLEGKTFREIEVNSGDLRVGNNEYRKKVKRGVYNDNYDLPIGLYLKSEDKYKLVDGYHRYVDLVTKDKIVKIISAE